MAGRLVDGWRMARASTHRCAEPSAGHYFVLGCAPVYHSVGCLRCPDRRLGHDRPAGRYGGQDILPAGAVDGRRVAEARYDTPGTAWVFHQPALPLADSTLRPWHPIFGPCLVCVSEASPATRQARPLAHQPHQGDTRRRARDGRGRHCRRGHRGGHRAVPDHEPASATAVDGAADIGLTGIAP